ncbi:MAG: glycosyltransferase family 4 protein [Myxococcota bacterium]
MIRTLFVTHTLDFTAGGAERVLYEVLLRLDRERFAPRVFTAADPDGVPEAFRDLGVPIEEGRYLPVGVGLHPRGLVETLAAFISLARALGRALDRDPVDVVYVNSIFALHFAMTPCTRRGIPIVFHEHGLPHLRAGSLWSLGYRRRLPRFAHVVAITNAVRDEVIENGLDPDRVTTVYNGIDARAPTSDEPKREGFAIAQVANFLDWKGQDIVVEAMKTLRERVPDATITFFGTVKDDEYHDGVRARVSALGLEDAVEFGGFREDLSRLLPTFDALVVASKAEPFGLVLLEGMRAGLGVVGSASGGVPEIVEDGVNGLLFEPGNAEALADAFVQLATDPETKHRLVAAGERTVRDVFSLEAQLAGIQAVIEHVAEAPLS